MKKLLFIFALSLSSIFITAEQDNKTTPFYTVFEEKFQKANDLSAFEKEEYKICIDYYKNGKMTAEEYKQKRINLLIKYYDFLKEFMAFTGKRSAASAIKKSLESALPQMKLRIEIELDYLRLQAKEKNCSNYENYLKIEQEIADLTIKEYKKYTTEVVAILENI